MATARKLFNAIQSNKEEIPLNKQFLRSVMENIELKSVEGARPSSNWYKPSGLGCIRQMYFGRIQAPKDERPSEYNAIGMADTGTRRHEAIQDVLMFMSDKSDWVYLDVAEYIENKQKQGKLLNIIVKGKRGVETHLFDKTLQTSFMCDGLLLYKPTNTNYLFEFKNQISFKFKDKKCVDKEHHNQVTCYCTSLDLDYALVLYEDRDTTTLECPEVFEVTQEMKNNLVSHIMECEDYVERMIVPPKPDNVKCNFCGYKSMCRKSG